MPLQAGRLRGRPHAPGSIPVDGSSSRITGAPPTSATWPTGIIIARRLRGNCNACALNKQAVPAAVGWTTRPAWPHPTAASTASRSPHQRALQLPLRATHCHRQLAPVAAAVAGAGAVCVLNQAQLLQQVGSLRVHQPLRQAPAWRGARSGVAGHGTLQTGSSAGGARSFHTHQPAASGPLRARSAACAAGLDWLCIGMLTAAGRTGASPPGPSSGQAGRCGGQSSGKQGCAERRESPMSRAVNH